MSIFSEIAGWLRTTKQVVPQSDGFRAAENPSSVVEKAFAFDSPNPLFGFGNIFPSNTGVPIGPYGSLQHPVFYAGVKALADDVARMPLLFEEKLENGWAPAEDHQLMAVLREPTHYLTPFNLWHYAVTSLKLWGQAFIYIERDRNGMPTSLMPLLPSQCSVLISDEGEVQYSFTHPLHHGGHVVDCTSMLAFRDMSLDAGLRGMSAVALSQDSLGAAIAAQTHGASMFRDGTLLQGILKTPNKISTEGAARMSESWKQAHSGATNAHKVAVLEEGLEFQSLQQTAEQAQLLETQKFGGENAARLLRLPAHKVGILDHATYSNIEQMSLGYLQDSLLPIVENFCAEMCLKLLIKSERQRYRFRWDFSSLLVTDTKSQFEAFAQAVQNGLLTINECRAKLGLPPDPDGDKLRVPLNSAPLDQVGNMPLGTPALKPTSGGEQVLDPK